MTARDVLTCDLSEEFHYMHHSSDKSNVPITERQQHAT